MGSGFLKLDKSDMKHLALEAALTAALGALTVFGAYASGHDIGTAGPFIMYLVGMASSAIKKALTDNTK